MKHKEQVEVAVKTKPKGIILVEKALADKRLIRETYAKGGNIEDVRDRLGAPPL